jgi:RNA polymerase sigma-70 factor, ECF subfamily
MVLLTEQDDRALVQRSIQGDRVAFEQLVVRYQKPVYNVALRLLRDAEEAKDIAQTTFLNVYEHLKDYDQGYKFYSWIYRIAINESLTVLGRRKSFEPISGSELDESPGPDLEAEGDETRGAIEDALMRLTPELRSVVVLRHVMQLSYEDMAETLALPEKTVKSRLYSARQQLRCILAQQGAV